MWILEIEANYREIHREKLLPYKIKKKQKKQSQYN